VRTVGAIGMSDYIKLNQSNSNHNVAELNRTFITTVMSVQLIMKEHSSKLRVSGRHTQKGENSLLLNDKILFAKETIGRVSGKS
jgi:hypothetical protein